MKAKKLPRYIFAPSHFYVFHDDAYHLQGQNTLTRLLLENVCFISLLYFNIMIRCRQMAPLRRKQNVRKTRKESTMTMTTTNMSKTRTWTKTTRLLQPSPKSVQLMRSPMRKPRKAQKKSRPEISRRSTTTVYPHKIRLKPLERVERVSMRQSTVTFAKM